MAKSSGPIFRSPTPDEERLIRLFRLLDSSARENILVSVTDQVAESLTRTSDQTTETEDEREERVKDFLTDQVSSATPYDDFLSTLADYVDLNDVFSDGKVQMVVGESRQDFETADALMDSYTAISYDHPHLVGTDEFFGGDSLEESNEYLRGWLVGVFQEWRFRFIDGLEEVETKRRSGGGHSTQ